MVKNQVRFALLVGLAASIVVATIAPAVAATHAVTGTATTSAGDGGPTSDFTYSSAGLLGSGTIHSEYELVFGQPLLGTEGTVVFTRSDGATLSGTGVGTVDLSSYPFPVITTFTLTSGTGALSGASGEITVTGRSGGPGVAGDVFTMTGTLTTPPLVPTDMDQCKNGGWKDLSDDDGEPFANQGRCVSHVATLG